MTARYLGLAVGYAVALGAWFAARTALPGLWPRRPLTSFRRPWLEVLWVLLAGAAVLLLGQLYMRGVRLPAGGALGPLAEAVNQALIFLPFPALLILRRQGLDTAWVKTSRLPERLGIGLGIALIALTAYLAARGHLPDWGAAAAGIYHPKRLGIAVQVFFEDFAIAAMLVRLEAGMKSRRVAAVAVAFLFAAAHIPALVAGGAAVAWMLSLVLDFGLAVGVIAAAQRSGDIWWLWCVHFTMDMTQFIPLR
jgi:hypothetical protein